MNAESNAKNVMMKQSTKLCRVCLTENIKMSKCVFDKINSSSIASMVMLCARVQIACRDGLPDIICARCLGDLRAANSFRLRCELADSLLRKSCNGTEQGNVWEHVKRHAPTSAKEKAFNEEWIDYGFEDNVDSDSLLQSPACEFTDPDSYEKSPSQSKLNFSSEIRENDDTALRKSKFFSTPERNEFNIQCQSVNSNKKNSFSCTECSFSVNYRVLLASHIKHAHSKTRKPRKYRKPVYSKCDVCLMPFPNLQYMKIHKMFCSVDLPFKSGFDYFRFSSILKKTRGSGDPKRRPKACSTKISFMCEMCGKQLSSQKILESHIKRHLNIRDFKCSFCKRCFVDQNDLNLHAKMHTDPTKKFECDVCGHKTRLKRGLIGHLMTHTGKKNFKCELCDHRSISKAALKMHIMSHSDERRLSCPICDVKFKRNPGIHKHMLKIHKTVYRVSDYLDRRMIKQQYSF